MNRCVLRWGVWKGSQVYFCVHCIIEGKRSLSTGNAVTRFTHSPWSDMALDVAAVGVRCTVVLAFVFFDVLVGCEIGKADLNNKGCRRATRRGRRDATPHLAQPSRARPRASRRPAAEGAIVIVVIVSIIPVVCVIVCIV